jgi:hypothetical protein
MHRTFRPRHPHPRPGAVRLFGTLLVLCLGFVHSVLAQTEESRSTHAMRHKVFEKLSRAQSAADTGDFPAAFDALEHVAGMKDLTPYEKAQLYTTMGYAYFLQQKPEESLQSYRRVLEQDDLPRGLEISTLLTVAQLEFQNGDHAAAIPVLQRWFALSENPGPEPYLLLAQAYTQQQQYRDAAEALESAVRIAESRGQQIPESWLGLQRSVYHELSDRVRLRQVLETLVTRFPSRAYWLHLAAVYGDMGLEERQLAAYEIAFESGYLERNDEVVLLAQLALNAGVPLTAAEALSAGMERGIVDRSADNHRLLSQAWALAHEDRRSIESLQQAAALSSDGEIDARLAQSYANLRQWDDAAQAARTALDKGIDDAQEVQLLLGTALFELGRLEEAQAAFQPAAQSPQTQERARQWMAYIAREQSRLANKTAP